MKLSALQQHYNAARRSNSFRGGGGPAPVDGSAATAIGEPPFSFAKASPAAAFWLLLHGLCCLVSLVLGFRFSRLVFFLLFSNPSSTSPSSSNAAVLPRHHATVVLSLDPSPPPPLAAMPNHTTVDGSAATAIGEPPFSFAKASPAAAFWLLLHGLCCLVSLVLGFRFSRLVFFLLFSNPSSTSPSSSNAAVLPRHHATVVLSLDPSPPPPLAAMPNHTTVGGAVAGGGGGSRVVVGRHGIRIRPWPHPNAEEVMRAHRILERVQREQRAQYGVRSPRPVIAVTPTYSRTFQALHLSGVMHSLMLVPYDLTWIVVEAGGAATDETTTLLARSGLRTIHVPFPGGMPVEWAERHRTEARMRLHALRIISEKRLDGIVVFTDDSNMHSVEFFDEIQSVKWVGALSVGILAHSGNAESAAAQAEQNDAVRENPTIPIQGPACNSSGALVGWHTFNTLPYAGNSAAYVGDPGTVMPMQLEWAGFVLNARLLWKDNEERPGWVRDVDSVLQNGEEIESPLALLKDASFVEPLGNCGKKVMLWWLRVEARADSKFPPRWIIDPPLEVTVPAKRTPWPDVPPELPSEKTTVISDHEVKRHSKSGRTSRSRHSSRSKRKREARVDTQTIGVSQSNVQGQ